MEYLVYNRPAIFSTSPDTYDKTNLYEIIKLLAQTNHNEAQEKNLAEAVAEIQQLLENLEKSNPIETIADQMTVATQAIEIVENNSTLKQRVIDALKSEGTEAFKEALDNAVANVLYQSPKVTLYLDNTSVIK